MKTVIPMVSPTKQIENAVVCVDDECSILRAEQNAFREFRKVISRLQPSSPDELTESDQPVQIANRTTSTAQVRRAYRETVMDVYQSQYSDSLEIHVHNDFSQRVGSSIVTDDPLTPSLRQNLLIEVSACIEQRSNLITALNDEREWLCTAQKRLEAIENDLKVLPCCSSDRLSFEELETTWVELDELERQCQQLLHDRQQFIMGRRQNSLSNSDPLIIDHYLYESLKSVHPVLQAIGNLIKRICHRRQGNEKSKTSSIADSRY